MKMNNELLSFGSDFFSDGLIFFCVKAIVMLIVAYLLVRAIYKANEVAIEKKHASRMSLEFLAKISKVIIYALCIFLILEDIIPLKGIGVALLGATSILSVVVGLAAQESLGNFLSGFFLAMNHPFKVGDVITLVDRNITGIVKDINFRQTTIMTFDNTKMIIPNSVMNTAVLEDKEYGQGKIIKYFSFYVDYDTNIDLARKLIYEAVSSVPEIIDTRSKKEIEEDKPLFTVHVNDFGESGIALMFPVAVKKFGDQTLALSKLREELLKRFRKNKIKFSYNKIEVVK